MGLQPTSASEDAASNLEAASLHSAKSADSDVTVRDGDLMLGCRGFQY